ncbi:MAG: rhamnogalacturonan acetylesterase [Clostridia bacterium]|nr:rhamnogalacturonan acetylesterase [Clostridia bacterium]
MREIWICGDSTAAVYDPSVTAMVGWGQALEEFLPPARVHNHAMAGRSTKTFLAEGRLDGLEGQIQPGDLLLIQFGHNDEGDKPERHTEPWTDFTENLKVFLRFARERGAQPVLLTPICMRVWQEGRLQPTHGEYLRAVRALAQAEKVPLIDLYAESFRLVEEAGEEGSKALFMHLAPGEDPRHPEGSADNTHTRLPAARPFAAFVARQLEAL